MSRRASRGRALSLTNGAAASNSSPQPSGRPIPRTSPSIGTPNLSASITSRPPTRSFVSHASFSAMEPANYSSSGLREQTAELASFAFGDPSSFKTVISPKRTVSVPDNAGLNYGQADTRQDSTAAPSSSTLPEPILEVSEPVSPDGTHPNTPRTASISNITKLLRSQSNSPEEHRVKTPRRPSIAVSDCSQEDEPRAEMFDTVGGANEETPLLKKTDVQDKNRTPDDNGPGDIEGQTHRTRKPNHLVALTRTFRHKVAESFHIATSPKAWSKKAIWEQGIKHPFSLLPCVFLGVLLNVLDGLSYGLILFPLGEPIFAHTGPDGISMFYVSCIVSQLTFSLGGSIFKGAVGSEMIEVVPFFHNMAYSVIAQVGTDRPEVVMSTTITSFALSSVITGIVFLALGAFKLGSLVNFFPRHILIGCIGGVGFFLFVTGLEVSARLDGNLEYTLATIKKLFEGDTIGLWITPLALSVVLLFAKRFTTSPYLVPGFFISIAALFYIIVSASPNLDVPEMRDRGWVFPAVESGVPFYNFYSYYEFKNIDWKALASTIPAMFALTFFGILHVPINIPALAIAAQEDDANLNRELVAHGISNAVSGFAGSIQNYLTYVNSEMFISNGGNSRLAGVLLAFATTGVWVAGPAMIGYVPIMVVGALIFYLGIALLEEALYDTWGKMNRLEYLTVLVIVLIMGIYDFVAGILAGILLACLNFVVQTSRKTAIRATYSGEIVESTVRRHPTQRNFLHEVGNQIYVTKLAGYLFFGSIVKVEKQSRALIEEEAFDKEPIRYLVFDLAHVNGIDYSAAEAFTRMVRVIGRRDVKMIISGVEKEAEVGKGLRNVGLWQEGSGVEFFEDLNLALEYCENELLRALYRRRDTMDQGDGSHPFLEIPKRESISSSNPLTSSGIAPNSPRRQFLEQAATSVLNDNPAPKKWQSFKQPLPLILQTFQQLTDKNEDFWFKVVPYFERKEFPQGSVLYHRGEQAKGFYLLETGILHAHYSLPVGRYHESIVAGTTCGELPFFSSSTRTATVSAERDCVCWRLGDDAWERMQQEWPEGAREVLKIALKLTKERVDAVTSYVLTTAG